MRWANCSLTTFRADARGELVHHATLERHIYSLPDPHHKQVAKMKREDIGVTINRLTVEQEHYLASWNEGT